MRKDRQITDPANRQALRAHSSKRTKQASSSAHSIFIIEDHPVFREGLVQILNREPDLWVCGEADNAEEALPMVKRRKPAVILVDLSLPGKSGLDFIKELRMSDHEVKVLVVSMHDQAIYADRVMRAGGNGYIMKHEDPEEILHAIRDLIAGHIYISENVLSNHQPANQKEYPKVQKSSLDLLTDSELELLELLGQGMNNQKIARQLHLSPRTVSSHCAQIRKKLGMKTAQELIRYAICWVETGAA